MEEKLLFVSMIVMLGSLASAFAESEGEDAIIGEVGEAIKIPADISLAKDEALLSVVWKRGEKVVVMIAVYQNLTTSNEPRASLDPIDYSLTLNNLNFSDAGEYTIVATTVKNMHTQLRSLKVLASPEVSVRVLPVVDDGSGVERVVAECYANGGSNQFTVEWYDGDTLVENVTSSVDSPNADHDFLTDSVLPLSMVPSAISDNGRTFTCKVIDAFGRQVDKNASLEITEPTTTVPTTTMQAHPVIVKFANQKSITLIMGKSRTLTCRATGVPEPTVSWYKDGSKMPGQTGEVKVEVVADDYSKSGAYRCEARNGEGVDKREVTISVQGPPVIYGVDALVNGTESYVLTPDDDQVQLKCESDAHPIPDIIWSVEDFNLADLKTSDELISAEGRATSYLNISAKHFINDDPVTKVVCTASNPHGDVKKTYLVSAPLPVAASNIGLVVGMVIGLVLFLIIVIAVALYCLRNRKRQGTLAANPESGKACELSACCGDSKVKSKELEEEDDGVTVERSKGVEEAGTQEEKQRLTQAEEEPAKTEETNDEKKEADEGAAKDDEPKKSKRKIPLPVQCCRGKKEEKEAENDGVEEGQNADHQETENGDTKAREETEKDSVKGAALEKVLEDNATEK